MTAYHSAFSDIVKPAIQVCLLYAGMQCLCNGRIRVWIQAFHAFYPGKWKSKSAWVSVPCSLYDSCKITAILSDLLKVFRSHLLPSSDAGQPIMRRILLMG
jgi:hypothetical protein